MRESMLSSRNLFILILIAGALLRFLLYDLRPLDADETLRVQIASQSLKSVFVEAFEGPQPEPNPPLFTLILLCLVKIQPSLFFIRLAPIAGALLAGILVYYAGKSAFNPRTGLLAFALLLLSPWFVHLSLEAKQYTWMAAGGAALFLALLNCRAKPGDSFAAGLYFLCAQFLLWTHYSGLFLLFAFFAAQAFADRNGLKRWCALHFLILLFYSPFLWMIFKILAAGSTRVDWIPPFSFMEIPRLFLIHFLGLEFIPKDPESNLYYLRTAVVWPFRLGVMWILLKSIRTVFRPHNGERDREPLAATLVFLFGPLLLFIVFSLAIKPIYQEEYMATVYPAFTLWLAHSICKFRSPRFRLIMGIGLSVLWVWSMGSYSIS